MVISVRVSSIVGQVEKKLYKDGDCDVEAYIVNDLPVFSVTAVGAIEVLQPIKDVNSLPPKSHPDHRMSSLQHNHPFLKLSRPQRVEHELQNAWCMYS